MRADKFDLSRLLRETLSCGRRAKRAVKGESLDAPDGSHESDAALDGPLPPLP
jgi:hypothetical protein